MLENYEEELSAAYYTVIGAHIFTTW